MLYKRWISALVALILLVLVPMNVNADMPENNQREESVISDFSTASEELLSESEETCEYSAEQLSDETKEAESGKSNDAGLQEDSRETEEPDVPQDQWVYSGGRWYYLYADGTYPKNGWEWIQGHWYLFDARGWMLTGWQKVSGKWYYLGSSGAMATGWQKINGIWYFFISSGSMVTGWNKIGGSWYYMDSSGAMLTGWQKIKGDWYYLRTSGAMKTGWILLGNVWYYLDGSGVMQTGWQNIGGVDYYFYKYRYPSGGMASDQWIGNYYLNEDGVWVRTGNPSKLRILFIGNSHTTVNNMPGQVVDRANEYGYHCSKSVIAKDNRSLSYYASNSSTKKTIADGKYDYVVLQEHAHPFPSNSTYFSAVRTLNQCIKNAGSNTVIFMVWARKDEKSKQASISAAHKSIASELGAVLAPVGDVWWEYMKNNPGINLFQSDGEHASAAGAYQTAKCIWNSIYSDLE